MKQCQEFLGGNNKWADAARDINAFVSQNAFYAARYINLYQYAMGEYHDIVDEYQGG